MRMKTVNLPSRPQDSELLELRARLREAEETLAAIRAGEVDALVIHGSKRDQVFTLQGAEKPYRLLIEAMNEGALTILHDGTVLYCNNAFATMIGRPIEKIIGGSFFQFLMSEDKHRLRQMLASLSESGAKGEFTLQSSRHRPAKLPVQLSLALIDVDCVKSVSVVATDLSEGKRQQEILHQLNVALEQRVSERTAELSRANEALGEAHRRLNREAQDLEEEVGERTAELQRTVQSMEQFCYSIAHDLRAPLRTMSGFTYSLLHDFGAVLPPEGQDFAHRINAAAQRMDEMIRDLLSYGRINSAELPMGVVDPLPFIEQFVRSSDGQQATIHIERPLPKLRANSIALDQALRNLLSNAVKFKKPDVPAKVRVFAENDGHDWVRLWVEDDGVGIDPRYQDRIFRPFERACSPGYSGTGIGLAIVQKAVERMGGRVGVKSELGKGSRFWIQLRKAQST